MKLFPKIKPYRSGYLDVGEGHEIYYELVGNPKGKPLLFVHGGPGAGCSPWSRRFFNPKKWNAILFDQRGAGRSKPFCSTKNNTAWKLVADMRKLLRFLKIKQVFLFGGSWGSTLSLVYAIRHPETVKGMLLRGIFLARKWDLQYTFGGGAQEYFPDSWQRFLSVVPKKYRSNSMKIIRYYLSKMESRNKKAARKHAYEWSRYELSMLKKHMTELEIRKAQKEYSYQSMALLEAYYMKNRCFLPENYILKNVARMAKIPLAIVHGRHDVICPPIQAWLLHKALKNSRLIYTDAGHGSSEDENMKALLRELGKVK